MNFTMKEVSQFVQENDVKFIRLAFCDVFGTQKNISIMPHELERAFQTGISFDASAIAGFKGVEESDLFLVPDPGTLSILPWRPQQGRVVRFFCDIKNPDGSSFHSDTRNILKQAEKRAADLNYICKIGAECEFYLFETDEKGNPTDIPYDRGGYLDIAPLDKCENVRREICLTLEQMGINPESSHHEQGNGQNEIDFQYSDALSAADNLITFKSVVKSIAARNGLYASFMPKPIANMSGSGLHTNISLMKFDHNIFKPTDEGLSPIAKHFIAGILNKISEITAFLNPLTNSYARFGQFEAPKYISWSKQNRSQLIRIPAAIDNYARMELRSPDPACNPYLAFALLIHAGLDGIEQELPLEEPTNFNLYTASKEKTQNLKLLPQTLKDALELMKQSEFVKKIIPQATIEKYYEMKIAEWEKYAYSNEKQNIDKQLYFHII